MDSHEGEPLGAPLERARPASERAMIQTRRDLARIGIDAAQLRSPSDGDAILKLRCCVDARQLPSEAVRNEAYLSLKSGDGTLARAGARLMRDVIALFATRRVRVPDDRHRTWRGATGRGCVARGH